MTHCNLYFVDNMSNNSVSMSNFFMKTVEVNALTEKMRENKLKTLMLLFHYIEMLHFVSFCFILLLMSCEA